jgi:hypothetical protein
VLLVRAFQSPQLAIPRGRVGEIRADLNQALAAIRGSGEKIHFETFARLAAGNLPAGARQFANHNILEQMAAIEFFCGTERGGQRVIRQIEFAGIENKRLHQATGRLFHRSSPDFRYRCSWTGLHLSRV